MELAVSKMMEMDRINLSGYLAPAEPGQDDLKLAHVKPKN